MSTAAQVRAAFENTLFADSTLKTITPNLYLFDLEEIAAVSTAHSAKMMHEQKVHFLAGRVARALKWELSGGTGTGAVTSYEYPIYFKYYRDAKEDLTGAAYNAIEDYYGTFMARLVAVLGATLGGTVDYWMPQDGEMSISLGVIDARPVWVGSYSLRGFKQATFV